MQPQDDDRGYKDRRKPEMNFARSFFKFLVSSEEMNIPRAAVLEMQGGARNSVMLRHCNGEMWVVEVERNRDRWCFKKGWPKFYQDNSLEQLDALVFEYKANNLFDFKVFGPDMCEKKVVDSANSQVKEEEQDEEATDTDKEAIDDDDHDFVDDDMYEENEACSGDDDDDDDYVQEEEEYEEEYEQVQTCTKTKSKSVGTSNRNLRRTDTSGVGTLSIKRRKNVTEMEGKKALMCKVREEEVEDEREKEQSRGIDDHENDNQMEDRDFSKTGKYKSTSAAAHNTSCSSKHKATFGIGTLPSRRMYQKKNIPDCYGADIFEAGLATRPVNRPFFVSRSRTSRKNELFIPKDVIVDYHLNIPEKVFVVDESGRRWKTKVKQWKDGRIWCSGGWRSLCNVNMIKKEDCCICEFVGHGCEDMHILVRRVEVPASLHQV